MDQSDQIVISGIAGRFPQCENIEQFKQGLLDGTDLIGSCEKRYPPGIYGVPSRLGCIPEIDKFDASYFEIHHKQANYMDPRQRILLETVYEAIIDAGYNPKDLRGSKTGVYVGIAHFSNADMYRKHETDGYTSIGLSLALAANRVSYCFDFNGPSYSLDTACSSSLIAFVNAVTDMKEGRIDHAIIGGAELQMHPQETLAFFRLNMLSPDGTCKVFSTERDGYVRSETVCSYFLTRKSTARRIYATVLGAKSNTDGFKKEGITYPSTEFQYQLMNSVYSSIGIDPNTIDYVEAHGTGTLVGDVIECQTIANQFCKTRKEPLLIGAVKSNMGHAETASGLCSLTKVLVAFESGIIPANLYADKIDYTIPGIAENKLKVVSKNTKWNGGVVGINSFGFGGANAHIVLKSHTKEQTKPYNRPNHRLVQVSGRTEEAVLHFLDGIENNQDDPEFLALTDAIHYANIEGHNYRGYIVLGDRPAKEITRVSTSRPIFFIYSGMGSQWNQMGRDLMKIDLCRKTLNRCATALKPYNVDLINILTSEDPNIFDNIMNCFCAIGAIEIALTDFLYDLGIYPDGIAGHSLGEVGCSYADGTITPEQAILLSYARGYGSVNTKKSPGQMAAIGLSHKEVRKILPSDVYVACQNSSTSCTISGSEDSTKAFVEKLSAQGVFARLVKSAGFAFHTKYVKEAGDLLLEFCKGILKDPKPRSNKWLTTSVPPSNENEKWAQYNCAEYHYNNFSNTVLFDQVYERIPENAIVIEVAPHGLLQAILKREISSQATYISLVNRTSDDNEQFLLSSIGKIYMAGGQPDMRRLYNEVSFPVAPKTTMLAPFVKWDHSISWYTPIFENQDSFGQTLTIILSDKRYAYLQGHDIDGRILMPGTGYLDLVWQLVATMNLKNQNEMPIVITSVKFKRATILSFTESTTFLINIMKKSGNFEIFESGSVVCTGTIQLPKDISSEFVLKEVKEIPRNGCAVMKREDVYKECRLRKYFYKGDFQGISECDVHGLTGLVEWKGIFCSFLDTMMHLTVIADTSRDFMLPISIQKIVIDPIHHLNLVEKENNLPLLFDSDLGILKSGGIEIIGLDSSKAPRRANVQAKPYLETYDFIYYDSSIKNQYDLDTSLRLAIQIIVQNITGPMKQMSVCEIITASKNEDLNKSIKTIINQQPFVDVDFISQTIEEIKSKHEVIVLSEEVNIDIDVETLTSNLTDNGFILYKGNIDKLQPNSLQVVFRAVADIDSIYLLRPTFDFPKNYAVVNIRNSDFNWLEKIQTLAKCDDDKVVYLFSQDEDTSGIIGLVNCLITEPTNIKFRSILIDQQTDKFSTDDEFYRNQLKKNLIHNVLRNNNWGTFVHLPMKNIEKKDVGNAAATIGIVGDLTSLDWVERPFEGIRYNNTGSTVYVYYSALNFKDVMTTTGKLNLRSTSMPTSPETSLGLEYSGVTAKGKRVMGIVPYESIALQCISDPNFTWEVPKNWSLKDAATVPTIYATCYFGLILKGQLQPGESILIHAGTGGIGIAAINIALSMGCRIFTTVGSKEKREFLKKLFPTIRDEDIGNSRDASFEVLIKKNTKGQGVNVVLNSLSGELFTASMRCLSNGGRFVEIGKVDLLNSTPIESRMFLQNTSFHGVHLNELFFDESSVKQDIQYLVTEGIAMGVVKPLPSTVYDETQLESALRYMATGKHRGKVLIEIRKEEICPTTAPIRSISALPSLYFDPKKSFILVGGLGRFGLELTDWLIKKGATKIVLNSRSGLLNGYQSYCLKKWSQHKNIVVKIDTNDTSTLKGAEALISFAQQLGTVGGIFNMAIVLRDNSILNQTTQAFEEVFKTKIISGQNMDTVSRKLCKDLEHFVVFSSLTSGRGNFGQSNYGMANSALERLCEIRKKEHLPAVGVQYGPVGEVGALTKLGIAEQSLRNIQPQKIASCLDALEKCMLQPCAIGSSVVFDEGNDKTNAKVMLTPAEAVAHILGINNLDLLDKTLTLSQQGLDSLMTTEIKQTLYRNYQLELSQGEIRNITFYMLIALGGESNEEQKTISTVQEIIPIVVNDVNYLLPKEVVVKMNFTSNPKENIFLFHPIEGNVDILKSIATKLRANVYGFQASTEIQANTMDVIAKYYIEKLKQIQPKGPYRLCGYSYGGSVGLEISLQLEKAGDKVDFISIDSSPIFINYLLKSAHMRLENSMEKSQIAVLETFTSSFPRVNQDEVAVFLREIPNWKEQVDNISQLISKVEGIDKTKISQAANSFFDRVHASYYYEPSSTFEGKILLIRKDDNPFFLSDNYELQMICKQPVNILKLKGDHKTILLGDNAQRVADAINTFFKV